MLCIYHCLDDVELDVVHGSVEKALKPGGMLAVAVFNDELPIPEEHFTAGVVLRRRDYVPNMVRGWRKIAEEYGVLREDHLRLVGTHHHPLT